MLGLGRAYVRGDSSKARTARSLTRKWAPTCMLRYLPDQTQRVGLHFRIVSVHPHGGERCFQAALSKNQPPDLRLCMCEVPQVSDAPCLHMELPSERAQHAHCRGDASALGYAQPIGCAGELAVPARTCKRR